MMEHATQILTITIGRSEGTSVRLNSPSVSGRHATLTVHDGRLELTDLGSSNGTFVNGKRISTAFVTPRDRVLIGTAPFPWNHPALIPIENKRSFFEVSGEVLENVDPIFFGDLRQAAFKALGLT